MNWDEISKESDLSFSFLVEHIDQLDWLLVSRYITLDEQIIEAFHDKLFWNIFYENPSFTMELVEEIKGSPCMNWNHFASYYPITVEIYERFKTHIDVRLLKKNRVTTIKMVETNFMMNLESDGVTVTSQEEYVMKDTVTGKTYRFVVDVYEG